MQKTITVDGKKITIQKAAAITDKLFDLLRKEARERGEKRCAQMYCDAQALMHSEVPVK